MARKLVKTSENGTRSARLQALFTDDRKHKPILDMLEAFDKQKGYSQKDVLYKALHLLAHRWSKKLGFKATVEPETHIADIMTLLRQLYQGQNEMMDAILKMRSGVITMQEFDDRVSGIHEKQATSMGLLEGASEYASGMFMLEDDEDEDE